MNIPVGVARAQGQHGIKGAEHGIKGGRPRLELTDEERAKRRAEQHQAYRRRKGIMPREVLTWDERRERDRLQRQERLNAEYFKVWRKLPGEPLTPREFEARQKAFRAWVRFCQARNCNSSPVEPVRKHYREIFRAERQNERNGLDLEKRLQHIKEYEAPLVSQSEQKTIRLGWNDLCPCGSGLKARKCCHKQSSSVVAPVVPERNAPCPCGSGFKFKKCCG